MPAGPSGVVVLTVIYVLIAVSTVIIGARIYLRLVIQKQRLVTADWLRISAWCTAFVTGFFDILKVKVSVYCIFLLGIIDIAFSLTRFLTIQLGDSEDFRSFTIIELWCSLDVYIGLVICCIPALRPYLHRKGVNYTIHESGRPSKSGHAIRRTGQSGFEEITEGSGLRGDGRDDSWSISQSCEITAELTDKKENGSDIELVSIEVSKSSV
ncbi:integral membrane protein [Fusarium pseudoanthophilum]|uniref:Integral membrane protein n=1 Tax=Fusarium pseudoanthophilum TaxID=48495 RepID=A0A8H5NQJ4_9HYPO|nr:integral membrane protein [Fusarium pseudoanthophilum]